MFKSKLSSESLRPVFGMALRTVATMAILSTGLGIAGAQAPAATTDQAAPTVAAQPALNVQAPALDTASAQLFSSSNDSAAETTNEASLNPTTGANFANMMQYGGGQRRRYGAPRYRGSNTNQDGSPKYTFLAGVGLVQSIGNTFKYLTPSYGFQVGAGRNFNSKLGLLVQFDYDHFGFTKANISNESYIYTGDSNAGDNGIDANTHIWSFTLNPVYTITRGGSGGLGAYVVAGVGFYHKVANLTAPQTEVACGYYGCEEFDVQSNFAEYTSNAPGFNGGFGLTYKFSRFSNERFYAEARYVFIDNSQRQGYTTATIANAPATATNFYPANSNRTTYIPIKVGLRF